MLAAENGAILGAKVGGMADVIRDLPAALSAVDIVADMIMPNYGFLAQSVNAQPLAEISVSFADEPLTVMIYCIPHPKVEHCKVYFVEHAKLQNDNGGIYSQGHAYRPFAQDATKFALFCLSVAVVLKEGVIALPDRVHLHDWHMGMFAFLRAFDPHFILLKAIPCVFSIHNLALQGARPLTDDPDSLSSWYPSLFELLSQKQKNKVIDVNYLDCINPMRAGIVLSDKVHLVSPSYAKEVLKPSNHRFGFFGGEGLEADLKQKVKAGQVVGILNACVYDEPEYALTAQLQLELSIEHALLLTPSLPENVMISRAVSVTTNKPSVWQAQSAKLSDITKLIFLAERALLTWLAMGDKVSPQDSIALNRITRLWRRLNTGWQPDFIMTSVGRLTDQKMLILRQPYQKEGVKTITVLEAVLDIFLAKRPNGLFFLIGSGDSDIANEFKVLAAKYHQFIFLNGYNEALADSLYRLGDLFLMPSSFEPCGISQMLAMRSGQVCLVHGVGGLKDTVSNNKTGFVFKGATLTEQSEQLLQIFDKALNSVGTAKWLSMQKNAKKQRFLWSDIAAQYQTDLYEFSQSVSQASKLPIRRVK
ncbi:glycogen synthase [Shewanella surugensis]|uniref:starch synthase n=1 Tax=Shewanella surugensis TaxID=212020 RepID=A0ABT0LFY7_9GAMM|nr:glycogen/starch synthase [Shewanella surugensis]